MNTQELIRKIATMETRINTSTKIDVFDRALIIADITGLSKTEALSLILKVRMEALQ